jgi:hypothetical protein
MGTIAGEARARQSKQFIASRQISAGTAARAKQIGGEAMITTAVKHALPTQTLRHIQQELLVTVQKGAPRMSPPDPTPLVTRRDARRLTHQATIRAIEQKKRRALEQRITRLEATIRTFLTTMTLTEQRRDRCARTSGARTEARRPPQGRVSVHWRLKQTDDDDVFKPARPPYQTHQASRGRRHRPRGSVGSLSSITGLARRGRASGRASWASQGVAPRR